MAQWTDPFPDPDSPETNPLFSINNVSTTSSIIPTVTQNQTTQTCQPTSTTDPTDSDGMTTAPALSSLTTVASVFRRPTTRCTPRRHVRAYRCMQGHVRRVRDVLRGCDRAGCLSEICCHRAKEQRAARVAEILGSVGYRIGWGVFVLTIPTSAQPSTLKDLKRLRHAAIDVVKTWLRQWPFGHIEATSHLDVGGVLILHPCGDDEEVFGLHMNVIVPLVGVDHERSERFYGRRRVPVAALKDLNRVWAAALHDLGYEVPEDVLTYYRVPGSAKQWPPLLRYYCRVFPGWTASSQRISYWGLFRRGIPGETYEFAGRWMMPRKRPGRCEQCDAVHDLDITYDPETGRTTCRRIPQINYEKDLVRRSRKKPSAPKKSDQDNMKEV